MEVHIILTAFLLNISVGREDRLMKLVVSSIELNVKKFVNYVADCFTVATNQVLRLYSLRTLGTELFKVSDEFGERICQVAFEVFKWYEYAKFLRLNAIE